MTVIGVWKLCALVVLSSTVVEASFSVAKYPDAEPVCGGTPSDSLDWATYSDITQCEQVGGTGSGYVKVTCGLHLEITKFTSADCTTGATLWMRIAKANSAAFFSGTCSVNSVGGNYFKASPAWTGTNPCIAVVGSVSGDPIAAYGRKRSEFHLPVGVPVLLFQGLHMKVWGSTFPGLFGDQWLERIFVLSKEDNKVIDVAIKNDLVDFNRSLMEPGQIESLKVSVWRPMKTDLKVLPPAHGQWEIDGLTLRFSAESRIDEAHHSRIPRRECVSIQSFTTELSVCSISAVEFYGETLGEWDYAHLDMSFIGIDTEQKSLLKGVLPELWGLAPMSDRTKSFIIKEWLDDTDIPDGQGLVDLNVTKTDAALTV